MTLHPITVSKDISISECARIMSDRHVGSLLLSDKGKLCGLATEQDIVRKALAEGKSPGSTKAEEVMVRIDDLLTISPGKDIYEALTTMRDYNIRHLPVMDQGGLVGFLTIKDILKIQPQLFEILVEKFEIRESERKPIITGGDESMLCEECNSYSEDLEDIDGVKLCQECRGEESQENEEEEEVMF